ncbi:MAG TPA: APC family permease [Terracidiphilus sp.]|nr:APC family permease [Terracidiphilus sp.]
MSSLPALKRGIRFRDLALFYVVVSLGLRWTATAAAVGPSILVVWIGGLVCFFVPLAATVMELSERLPEEGGLYVWSREAFGDFAGFIAAWTYWMSNLPFFAGVLYFGAASVLFAFGPRAQSLAARPLYYVGFAVISLTLITLLNIRGIHVAKWLNNVGSLGSILPLSALMVMAAISWWRFGPATRFPAASFVPHWSIGNAVFWSTICLAYTGIESGSAMGDEIQNPRRTIPWAILVGGSILTIGYIGGTAALMVALPTQAIGGPDGFVSGIRQLCAHLGLGWLLVPIALLVGLNAVGGAAANLTANARLPFVVGIHHYLPAAFGWVHSRYRTPWVAITALGAAGVFVAVLSQAGTSVRGAYDVLVSMTVLSTLLPFLFIFGAMIRLQSRPIPPGARCVPGGKPVAITLASLGLLSTLATVALSIIPSADEVNKPLAVAKVVGGLIVLVGAGVFVFIGATLKASREAKTVPAD